MPPVLELSHISKTFPGVRALDDVSLEVHSGRVHGLVGENGAGKSTLLKILAGDYQPDQGTIRLQGKTQVFAHCRMALDAGVALIHQELHDVPELSVRDNLLLGRLPHTWGMLDTKGANAQVATYLQGKGINLDPSQPMKALSIARRQMVEIVRAVMRGALVVAFDEPSSSLSYNETRTLFRLVRTLKEEGAALIYVSHRLDEIFQLCDSCTVFRDGRCVAHHDSLTHVTPDSLIRDMVGRELKDVFGYRKRPLGKVRFHVHHLQGRACDVPADLSVCAGEIVGLFGLVGAGRSELMRRIYGGSYEKGHVLLDGQPLLKRSIPGMIRAGLMFCPEDRKNEGLFGCRSVMENITVSCCRHHRKFGVFLDKAQERTTADHFIHRLRIKTPHRSQQMSLLSGGNQQKVILARWLAEKNLKVLIVDEPTRGIDVGAKLEIYRVLYDLAEQGVALIMISSELPEVMGVADRILVMCQGRIRGDLSREEATEEKLLRLALPSQETL